MIRILLNILPPVNSQLNVPDEQIHHIVNVRRVKAGDEVECIDYDNNFCPGIIEEISKDEVIIRITGEIIQKEKLPHIILYSALLPEKKIDWIIQKCTEIGVTEFTPVLTEFCTAKFHPKNSEKKLARWNKIAEEAAKQCGGSPMKINHPETISKIFENNAKIKIICEKNGEKLEKITQKREKLDENRKIAVLIGPEGGFSKNELVSAENYGWTTVSFHQNILRTETAAVVCCSLIQHNIK